MVVVSWIEAVGPSTRYGPPGEGRMGSRDGQIPSRSRCGLSLVPHQESPLVLDSVAA